MKRKILWQVLDFVRHVAIAFVFALLIGRFVVVNAWVISGSMESTIMTDSRVLGFRLAYLIGEPERFDIILFRFPDDESAPPFVKRIIGLPGETVEIRDGKVFIDRAAEPLDDSFVNEVPVGDYGPFAIPADSYFVLGDNRNNSLDSKNWTRKFVPENNILGKVYIEYFPKPKILR